MSRPAITELLEERLGDWAAANGIQVAYDNIDFEPPDSIYLTSHDLPATPYAIDLSQRSKVFIGVYQVNVIIPAGIGRSEGRRIAGLIEERFVNGAEMQGDGFICYITGEPAQFAGITNDTAYTIPISMNYRADIIA
ncbi:phage tail terminator-like protein [Erwinia sp. 9145]|uniref:phage tail terminator-like protein n=1 Tax=Erwinia sp. 9145 TaxID=1500895 RepID=UPI0005538E53|nr:phage tail terminator-like protein [Erwinia sp. 9145]